MLNATEDAIGTGVTTTAVVGRLIRQVGIKHLIDHLFKQRPETGAALFYVRDGLLAQTERRVVVVGTGMLDEEQGRRYGGVGILLLDE